MEVNNPLYKNQGIHVVASIFTVEKGVVKVLIIKRKKDPFQGEWALVSGALYNNEEVMDGLRREIFEKTGIDNIELSLCNVFSKVDRSPSMRMVAITFLGVIDAMKVNVLRKTLKTDDADWVDIRLLPHLAFDHDEIIKDAKEKLKLAIVNSDVLKTLFPNGFTIPEIQKTYEAILEQKFDRRNFRRRLLNLGLIEDTNKEIKFEGKKCAKLYRFKNQISKNKTVL